ncbi:PREDICTED: uncharacterized protein LOC104707750 [Camelina sativa]|uniref:Uncharacterized protein LOC104707750 n=1 Tax=Camelina sativa TaxID=90675 RepID=A0ABM1QBM7_CAMSA|nr:PREDICTED: uncharacterized protein LOC104707750 [Camelina sativa]XP_019084166.1 PREDICTED: uncharacterized protein LOC104707750 [Camelina sativa]XP_019084167.1 PREDICTED: uncharacterized protein LOC104707750 [Camelina sativa]XP_019084168.1 PREDICTED: uncharacterized protein LOC104707750 [Camelina sativa]
MQSDEETSSLVTQPPEEIVGLGTQRHRSVYENVGFSSLVTQPSHQNPRVDQIARSGQAMNPHQQHTRPYRGSALHASYQNNFRQPLGMQQHPMANQFPNVVPMQTQMFNPGLAPAPWGPQNTYHQHPMANQISNVVPMQTQMFNPGLAPAPWGPQNTYHQHPMANQFPNVFPMQTQMLNPGLAPAPWGPHNTYQQHPMAYQFPNVVPMQTQMFNPGLAPAPWGPHNTYQQHPMAYQFPNVVPMQTQMFNRGPAPEIWRVQITYQQDSMGIQKFMPWHVFKQLDCPLSMGPIMSPVLAARDSGYVIEQRLISRGMRPRQDPVMHPYQHPEANQQNLRLGQFRSEDVFTTMKPDGQRRTFVIVRNPLNPQQRNFVYIDAVYVRAPLAEVHRMVQLHNQAQQPTLSEEVDGPASSEQGGDQVDGAASSERDQQQSQEVDDPASSEQGGDQQKQPR